MNAMFRWKHERRRGLAPLELVLALPILLMIMALMVNYGTMAAWKLRGHTAARYAAFSARWPRTGQSDPRPAYWPGSMEVEGAGNIARLDDQRVYHPVARGPLASGVQVNSELLDPSRGLRRGRASLTRGYPMIGKMGSYHLTAEVYFLDNMWQYQRFGLSSNVHLRIPTIYTFTQIMPLHDSYLTAARDNYYQQYSVPAAGRYSQLSALLSPDIDSVNWGWLAGYHLSSFAPGLRRFCSLDATTADNAVTNLVDRIEGSDSPWRAGVADRMTRGFYRFYRAVIRGAQNYVPPLPNAQSIIDMMQSKADQMDQFWDNSLNPGRPGP